MKHHSDLSCHPATKTPVAKMLSAVSQARSSISQFQHYHIVPCNGRCAAPTIFEMQLAPDPIPLADFETPQSPIRPSEHTLAGKRSRLCQGWTADDENENEVLGDPAVLLEYFASCKKGDAS